MRRLFLLIALSVCSCTPVVPAEQSGVIGGVVRNGWSKAPIKQAMVTLRTNGADILEALTYSDANGAFAFTGVPAGEYTLCARLNGYERACLGGSELGRPMPLFNLAAGQRKQDVILPMLPTGSVTGIVTDPDGDPVPNARVQLLRPVYARRTLHWQVAGGAATNDKGEYHLAFVQPGEYRIMTTGQFHQVFRIRPEAVAGQAVQEEMYVPQFYPGAASMDAAASLTLNAGNDLKGIDFTLNTTPQLTISGVVKPAAAMDKNAAVTIQFIPEPRLGTEQIINFGASPPEYTFQANVAAGRYHVVASWETADRAYRGEQAVEASAGVGNVAVTMAGGPPLVGKLIVEGESARQHGPYNIRLTPGDDLSGVPQPTSAEVSEKGVFEFPSVLPGVWDIGVTPTPSGSYIKSMRLGDQDVLTADMKLDDGTRKPLTIVLSMNGAVISGNVIMQSGSAPVRTRARLLLAPSGKQEEVMSFYETKLSDANGHFEFKGVTPGTYRIFAFDRLQPDEYWKPDFLKPFTATAGDAIEVVEGARLTHDATLIVRESGGGE